MCTTCTTHTTSLWHFCMREDGAAVCGSTEERTECVPVERGRSSVTVGCRQWGFGCSIASPGQLSTGREAGDVRVGFTQNKSPMLL